MAALKIDASFVRHMLEPRNNDFAIVKGVIELAHVFGRQSIAEGVEHLEHITALRDLGCDMGQGFAIAEPMAMDRLLTWCASWSERRHTIMGHDHAAEIPARGRSGA